VSEAYIPAAMRREVRERANGCCEYCLLAANDAYFPHESVVSLSSVYTFVQNRLMDWPPGSRRRHPKHGMRREDSMQKRGQSRMTLI
jgi:hypothetical protein